MMNAIRIQQARCAALGFNPGAIDGVNGPNTREAYALALEFQRKRNKPFIHSCGISRFHIHWTGGAHKANATDMSSYHILFEGDGNIINAAPHTAKRSHTLNANTGALGLSLCCMSGAIERPFSWGSHPMTEKQLLALVNECARLSNIYDIPVSRYSILSHAEIEPTLGVKQRQKWDTTVLPGMTSPASAVAVGDEIRKRIATERAKLK